MSIRVTMSWPRRRFPEITVPGSMAFKCPWHGNGCTAAGRYFTAPWGIMRRSLPSTKWRLCFAAECYGRLGSTALSLDKVLIPKIGVFGYSLLILEVDFHQTKCRTIATGPLEIVKQGPDKVSADLHTPLARFLHGSDVAVQVGHAVWIMNFSVCR